MKQRRRLFRLKQKNADAKMQAYQSVLYTRKFTFSLQFSTGKITEKK